MNLPHQQFGNETKSALEKIADLLKRKHHPKLIMQQDKKVFIPVLKTLHDNSSKNPKNNVFLR